MNDPISWDPSLVKKFSSSNHFKLLNQLRNEVKKYPLNNKKNSKILQNKDTIKDHKKNTNIEQSHNDIYSKNSNNSNDPNINKPNISFNNSKNFSIYNQTTTSNISTQNSKQINVQSNSPKDSSISSFKERLDQIDMK